MPSCHAFARGIMMSKPVALIVGAGPGISLAFAEALVGAGYQVGLAARNIEKLRPLAESVGAVPFTADASSADSIIQLFLAFFFQAEDGIRDYKVTGVQTCALPI